MCVCKDWGSLPCRALTHFRHIPSVRYNGMSKWSTTNADRKDAMSNSEGTSSSQAKTCTKPQSTRANRTTRRSISGGLLRTRRSRVVAAVTGLLAAAGLTLVGVQAADAFTPVGNTCSYETSCNDLPSTSSPSSGSDASSSNDDSSSSDDSLCDNYEQEQSANFAGSYTDGETGADAGAGLGELANDC